MAAALRVSPKTGSYEVGSTFSVNVSVDARDVAFNAVSGKLSFPSDTLEIVSVSKTLSVISLWVQEPEFSNYAGNVSFEGVVLNPGYKGSNGNIISIQFRVKKTGTASLSFISGEILANDGVGTGILSSLGTGFYTLVSKPVAINIKDFPLAPGIASTADTSANAAKAVIGSNSYPFYGWSNQTSGTFVFELEQGVTAMRLLVDDKPDSIPTVLYQPPIKEKALSDLPEGMSYLHLQLKDKNEWGEVRHYKLQIDTMTPEQVTIKEISQQYGTLKTFLFTASDTTSGIERYEISIDGSQSNILLATGAETYFSPSGLVAGIHTIEVKAFDKAGNFTLVSQQFEIIGSSWPTEDNALWSSITQNTDSFLMWLILLPLTFLIGFLIFIYLLTRVRQQEQQIALATQVAKHDAVRGIILLRTELKSEIALLEKTKEIRALTIEESKVLEGAQKSFTDTESYIEDYFHIPLEVATHT